MVIRRCCREQRRRKRRHAGWVPHSRTPCLRRERKSRLRRLTQLKRQRTRPTDDEVMGACDVMYARAAISCKQLGNQVVIVCPCSVHNPRTSRGTPVRSFPAKPSLFLLDPVLRLPDPVLRLLVEISIYTVSFEAAPLFMSCPSR